MHQTAPRDNSSGKSASSSVRTPELDGTARLGGLAAHSAEPFRPTVVFAPKLSIQNSAGAIADFRYE